MRAYQIEKDGPWVDLDTVQIIHPPTFENEMGFGGMFVTLRWRHAFQDKDSVLRWRQDWEKVRYTAVEDSEYYYAPKYTGDEPTELARVRELIYKPFLAAWVGDVNDKETKHV